MNPSPNIKPSTSVLKTIFEGTRKRSIKGAGYGLLGSVTLLSIFTAFKSTLYINEMGMRTLGFEPGFPYSKEDCELKQFHHLPVCQTKDGSIEYVPIPIYNWIPLIITTATFAGAGIGGAVGAVIEVSTALRDGVKAVTHAVSIASEQHFKKNNKKPTPGTKR